MASTTAEYEADIFNFQNTASKFPFILFINFRWLSKLLVVAPYLHSWQVFSMTGIVSTA